MADELDSTEYESWFSYLSPSPGYALLLLVSGSVTVGIFVLGYGIAAIMGNSSFYISSRTYHLTMVGIFGVLVWLGWADRVYTDLWNEVRSTFAVDDETYRGVVHPGLERMYDGRRVLRYGLIVGVPGLLLNTILDLPRLPSWIQPVQNFFVGETSSGLLTVAILDFMFVPIEVLLLVTAFNVLFTHVVLIRGVSELPFRDLYTSALDLEPVVGFGVASATAWFGGVTVVVLWAAEVEYGLLELGSILFLVFVGVIVFFAPLLILHSGLRDAKRRKLAEIRNEYEEIHGLMQRDPEPSEDLSLRLEVTDRRLESAKSIQTWPYNAASVWRLVMASAIPVLTLVDGVRQFINNGGGVG